MDSKKLKTAKINVNIGIGVISLASIMFLLAPFNFLAIFGLIVGIIYYIKAKKYKNELEKE